jgi:hypothetical protein
MGAGFRLKLSFSGGLRKLTPYCGRQGRATEMHYGPILADNGSNRYVGCAAFPQWPTVVVELLKLIPARDFEAVNESCLMVSSGSGQARAHAGCPIG